jgi:hypothetical protein
MFSKKAKKTFKDIAICKKFQEKVGSGTVKRELRLSIGQ